MEETITRKCSVCKQPITVDPCDIKGVVCYQKLYYHTSCFCEHAETLSNSKRSKAKEWKYALENLAELEGYARASIMANLKKPKQERKKVRKKTDDLNEYLLAYYNVQAVSDSNFWRMVMELQNGMYKGRRCKKIPIDTLLEAWKWAQPKLDQIHSKNKSKNKGPDNNQKRIAYDFAILIKHIDDFFNEQIRAASESEHIREVVQNTKKFNYEKLYQEVQKQNQKDDNNIFDLMNEIF